MTELRDRAIAILEEHETTNAERCYERLIKAIFDDAFIDALAEAALRGASIATVVRQFRPDK